MGQPGGTDGRGTVLPVGKEEPGRPERNPTIRMRLETNVLVKSAIPYPIIS